MMEIGYVSAIIGVISAVAVSAVVDRFSSVQPLLSFIVVIAFVASASGPGPGLVTLALSIIATNIFFLEPRLRLSWNIHMTRLAAFYAGAFLLALRVGRHI